MNDLKKIFHTKGKEKKAHVVIFISDNIGLKTKTTVKDEKGYYTMIKE